MLNIYHGQIPNETVATELFDHVKRSVIWHRVIIVIFFLWIGGDVFYN
jgi:hypothetical protein